MQDNPRNPQLVVERHSVIPPALLIFVCRADICDHIAFHKRDGKFVFMFGSGNPALHFVSLGGPVVVDSEDRLPAEPHSELVDG